MLQDTIILACQQQEVYPQQPDFCFTGTVHHGVPTLAKGFYMKLNFKKLFLLFFILSMLLPVAYAEKPFSEYNMNVGLIALLFGPMGGITMLVPVWSGVSWFANVFIAAALLLRKKKTLMIVCSSMALVLSLLFFGVQQIPKNEAGTMAKAYTGPGYWCWLIAILCLIGYSFTKQSRGAKAGSGR